MDVEELRTQRGLRLVTEAEEGAPLDGLPNGVYGFTYSLGLGSTPLFGKHTFQAFELHKLHDGSVELAGYVDEAGAAALARGDFGSELQLYPAPYGEAAQFATVPLRNVVLSSKGLSRGNGNYLSLRIAAGSNGVP